MKMEIDTNSDSYEMWKKVQALVEDAYREPVYKKAIIKQDVLDVPRNANSGWNQNGYGVLHKCSLIV